jgi:hypothetical protein
MLQIFPMRSQNIDFALDRRVYVLRLDYEFDEPAATGQDENISKTDVEKGG